MDQHVLASLAGVIITLICIGVVIFAIFSAIVYFWVLKVMKLATRLIENYDWSK